MFFSTWREGIGARTWFQFFQYNFGHVSGSYKFYIKAILGFLTTAEDTGASDHSF